MKEKQYDPARINDEGPAPGMAAVNTHNPDEIEAGVDKKSDQSDESDGLQRNDEPTERHE